MNRVAAAAAVVVKVVLAAVKSSIKFLSLSDHTKYIQTGPENVCLVWMDLVVLPKLGDLSTFVLPKCSKEPFPHNDPLT